MLQPFMTMFRLTTRGGPGLACDENGVALGPVALVDALSSNGGCVYRARPAEEIARTLALAYGAFSADDLARRLSGLDVAARALEEGDLAKAGIATVLLKLPPLTTEAFAKLAAEPTLRKYSPDQPRDERGRWTSEDEAAPQRLSGETQVAQEILIPGRVPFFLQDPPKLPQFKEPIPRLSGAEGAKNAPSWARGMRPRIGESGKDFAKRLLDEKYGPGNWEEDDGPSSEFSQIKKWGDRSFHDPKSVLTPEDQA
jgi:hypothetical protein